MRRLLAIVFATALAIPAAALGRDANPNEGSLSVTRANGSLILMGKGLLFGHVDHGVVTVLSYKPDGNAVPTVSGAKMKLVGNAINVVYTGSDVRFLFPGGRYQIEIDGVGIDISGVGRGSISALGAGTTDDGAIATDSAPPQRLSLVPMGAAWGQNGSKSSGS